MTTTSFVIKNQPTNFQIVTRHKDNYLCKIYPKNIFICYKVYRQNTKIDINLNIIMTALINDKKCIYYTYSSFSIKYIDYK